MTDPTPDVPTLRRLLAEATPGPREVAAELDGLLPEWAIWMPDAGCDRAMVDNEDDAALIVAAVNALPGILDERDRMLATDFEAVIDEHFVMWHEMGGNGEPPGEWRCQCGLKFGFSPTAVEHVATALRAALAEVTP